VKGRSRAEDCSLRAPQHDMQVDFASYTDIDALSRAAANTIEAAAQRAVATRGRFNLALSGGSTPRTLYHLLATDYRNRIPWSLSELFFGDERCVPPNHPESNFRMARETLLDEVPGLEARTHRIPGERGPEAAAKSYDVLLHTVFPGANPVTFDILLLGVGEDGHTASLFPGAPALEERQRWAVGTDAPPTSPIHERVTLTYPALDASLETLILVADPTKQPIIDRIRNNGASAAARYPVARITARERVRWLLTGLGRGTP
jgi:6-phosphogluconolactonase